ncbi:MAG TPA: CRTAC1 family protein [Pirellulales bacterium]|nr:CRTAC1 family protein [Pirellulales bacterium]
MSAIFLAAMVLMIVVVWKQFGVWIMMLDGYEPRHDVDTSGFLTAFSLVEPWRPDATLQEISDRWQRIGYRTIKQIDERLAAESLPVRMRFSYLSCKASMANYEGEAEVAYDVLSQIRSEMQSDPGLAREALYTIVFYQGVTALRRGENDNCIMCRGESSCILPISPAAVHINPEGSRLAIKHFTEYLDRFPDDLEVRWLLNLAHMTLGEHPDKVDPRYLISLDRFTNSEFDIGKFRDIGHLVGVNRFNQGGGAIMEDFDNDGLLDLATVAFDPSAPMGFYRNNGAGRFDDCAKAAGLENQLGGPNCVQTDYDNDGQMDIFIVRGAWLLYPERPSLLRNKGNGTFADVTDKAGLLYPMNSISASWADFDNDGWLDLFVAGERQPSRLFHNRKDGTFEEVSRQAGVDVEDQSDCKGVAWIDYDNDGYQDLFLNYLTTYAGTRLFRNNRDGTFTDVAEKMNIDGPAHGFSCWAWDYDNDGWLDIFATCFEHVLGDAVKGLQGEPHSLHSNKLYHNLQGHGFEDKTREAGLDMVFAAMGSNFADFDNDGFLDFYLGTGEPNLWFLKPARMFKNVAGARFAEITGSSRTGNLQKGHGVACGDWDRDGDVDLFIDMGGAVNGDRYHNILFQNPGQHNHWLTVKLVGVKSNRAAIGARIKVMTSGTSPLTVCRHVSSGSSFGANPLEQTIGLGQATRIESLEVYWPTSGTTQVFRDLAADRAVRVTEFANDYEVLDRKPITLSDS